MSTQCGVPTAQRCGPDRMGAQGIASEHGLMADDRSPMHTSDPSPHTTWALTRAEFDELVIELQALRDRHQADLAERLRDARAHGSPGDNEDVLAVHEEASVIGVRIARLEELLRSAPVDAREFNGCVSLGCVVRVADDDGRIAEYVLVGRRSDPSSNQEVSVGSPVGQALFGGHTGQTVRVELPDGRDRHFHILAVTPRSLVREPDFEPDAEAA